MILGHLRNFMFDESGDPKSYRFWRASSSGQALAEFAIVFPLQLILTFGLMQLILLMMSSLLVNYTSIRCCRSALVYYNPNSPDELDFSWDMPSNSPLIKVAQVILSPIAFTEISPFARSNVTIPDWGELVGSGSVYSKTKISVKLENDLLTTTVTFRQQLLFPFIDKLFVMVTPSTTRNNQGRFFGSKSEREGGIYVHKDSSGKEIVHYLITRSHTMPFSSSIGGTFPSIDSMGNQVESAHNYYIGRW